jgi:hypothetical protein
MSNLIAVGRIEGIDGFPRHKVQFVVVDRLELHIEVVVRLVLLPVVAVERLIQIQRTFL